MSMRLLERSIVAAVLFLGAAGCSDDGLDRSSVRVDNQNFCSEVARVLCHNMFQCCTGQEIESVLGIKVSPTTEGCLRDIELFCERRNYQLRGFIAKGTTTLLTEQATACVAAYVAEPDQCFALAGREPWADVCSAPMTEGQLGVEEPCDHSLECASGYCAADKKCRELPTEGKPCLNQSCAVGHYCDLSFDPETFKTTAICRLLQDINGACLASSNCLEGLFCELPPPADPPTTEPEKGKCQLKRAAGESCTAGSQCASSHCVPGLCASDLTETCYTDADCGGSCEADGSNCSRDSQCAGYCATSKYSCSSDSHCDVGESCVQKCNLDKCMGPAVCGDALQLVNYCSDAVEALLGKAP